MRVGLFTREYSPLVYGGAGVHVDYLSRELAKSIEVEVHCWGPQHIDDGNLHVRGAEPWAEITNGTEGKFKGALEAFSNFGRAITALRSHPLFALRNDMTQTLPSLIKTIPTIFIWGDSDTFALPETGREIERRLPDCKFHWIPGAGHQAQTDKPDACAKIIRQFLGP